MSTHRREFLQAVGGLAAGGLALGGAAVFAAGTKASGRGTGALAIGGVAFDAFTLLDFRQLPAAAERVFPGQGARFEELWRTRLFEYNGLRVLGGQYRDFEGVSADAFGFASAARERIAFVAHGGWDAAGAGWFGFPTYWLNRAGIARDELGVAPAATLPSLTPLPGLLAKGGPPATR